jgi:hypothetical protein
MLTQDRTERQKAVRDKEMLGKIAGQEGGPCPRFKFEST